MTVSTEELPPRPRRRLVTPVTGTFAAVLLLAGGFIGGVEVQKGQQDGGGGGARAGGAGAFAAAAGARGGGFGARGGGAPGGGTGAAAGGGAPGGFGGGGAGGAPGGGATIGSVANKKGSTLYVTGTDGTTVKVKTNANSKVTRTAANSVRGVYPGDSVVIQGSAASDGTVTATQIIATAGGVTSGLGALFGGGGGGGGGRAGGTTPGAGG